MSCHITYTDTTASIAILGVPLNIIFHVIQFFMRFVILIGCLLSLAEVGTIQMRILTFSRFWNFFYQYVLPLSLLNLQKIFRPCTRTIIDRSSDKYLFLDTSANGILTHLFALLSLNLFNPLLIEFLLISNASIKECT